MIPSYPSLSGNLLLEGKPLEGQGRFSYVYAPSDYSAQCLMHSVSIQMCTIKIENDKCHKQEGKWAIILLAAMIQEQVRAWRSDWIGEQAFQAGRTRPRKKYMAGIFQEATVVGGLVTAEQSYDDEAGGIRDHCPWAPGLQTEGRPQERLLTFYWNSWKTTV